MIFPNLFRALFEVTNRTVTAKTRQAVAIALTVSAFDCVGDFLMTFATGLFQDVAARLGNLDVVLESPGSEIVGVPKAVLCFGQVLPHEARRSMTVVADGDRSVRRLNPTGELLVHYMTVGTCFRLISHISPAASIGEGIGRHAYGDAYCYSQHDTLDSANRHGKLRKWPAPNVESVFSSDLKTVFR